MNRFRPHPKETKVTRIQNEPRRTKKERSGFSHRRIVRSLLFTTVLCFATVKYLKVTEIEDNHTMPKFAGKGRPAKCTREELLKVRSQLIPDFCPTARHRPHLQSCSLTTATKCVEPTSWLDDYYSELQKERDLDVPFLGISIGCNKGFDALGTFRMGTFDSGLDKSAWGKAMLRDGEIHHSVCKQDATAPFKVDQDKKTRLGEMHCIEPMPATFKMLKGSAKTLEYDTKGFKVVHGAVSNESGKALFPSGGMVGGVENKGLANCAAIHDKEKRRQVCEEIDVFTLKEYIATHVKSDGPIHNLSIDVEGFDGDVLLGAGAEVLGRVEYLEFEYNWMGSWKRQHLHDMVDMLDDIGFVCYWAGLDRLWRITDCWMRYYDIHTWSNVACVNRPSVPRLASKMEAVFRRTLKEDKVWMAEKFTESDRTTQRAKYAGDVIFSTEHEEMTLKYL